MNKQKADAAGEATVSMDSRLVAAVTEAPMHPWKRKVKLRPMDLAKAEDWDLDGWVEYENLRDHAAVDHYLGQSPRNGAFYAPPPKKGNRFLAPSPYLPPGHKVQRQKKCGVCGLQQGGLCRPFASTSSARRSTPSWIAPTAPRRTGGSTRT